MRGANKNIRSDKPYITTDSIRNITEDSVIVGKDRSEQESIDQARTRHMVETGEFDSSVARDETWERFLLQQREDRYDDQ